MHTIQYRIASGIYIVALNLNKIFREGAREMMNEDYQEKRSWSM